MDIEIKNKENINKTKSLELENFRGIVRKKIQFDKVLESLSNFNESSKKFGQIYENIKQCGDSAKKTSDEKLTKYSAIVQQLIRKIKTIINVNLDEDNFKKYLELDNVGSVEKNTKKTIKTITAEERREFYKEYFQTLLSSLQEINIGIEDYQSKSRKNNINLKIDEDQNTDSVQQNADALEQSKKNLNMLIASKLFDPKEILKNCNFTRLKEQFNKTLKGFTNEPVENNLCELLKRFTANLTDLDKKINLYNPIIKTMILIDKEIKSIDDKAEKLINKIFDPKLMGLNMGKGHNIKYVQYNNQTRNKIDAKQIEINNSKKEYIQTIKFFKKHFFIQLVKSESDVDFLKNNTFNMFKFANSLKHEFKQEHGLWDPFYKLDKEHGNIRRQLDFWLPRLRSKAVLGGAAVVTALILPASTPTIAATFGSVIVFISVVEACSKFQKYYSTEYKIKNLEKLFYLEEISLKETITKNVFIELNNITALALNNLQYN